MQGEGRMQIRVGFDLVYECPQLTGQHAWQRPTG